ncbi:hypothetical protein OH779_00090 [Actinacidiphila glaucinigra]|uniref:hypothetical protein n=1 Tax=Actinacidiphila glaucinigra TaxID=235986 RepID=UPI00386CD791
MRDLVGAGTVLHPRNGFVELDDEIGQWLYAQCATYADLAEQQRQQLAELGVTESAAAAARPNPATKHPSLVNRSGFGRDLIRCV